MSRRSFFRTLLSAALTAAAQVYGPSALRLPAVPKSIVVLMQEAMERLSADANRPQFFWRHVAFRGVPIHFDGSLVE